MMSASFIVIAAAASCLLIGVILAMVIGAYYMQRPGRDRDKEQ